MQHCAIMRNISIVYIAHYGAMRGLFQCGPAAAAARYLRFGNRRVPPMGSKKNDSSATPLSRQAPAKSRKG